MGLQVIQGQAGYVVEFAELPALPITGVGVEAPYAQALTEALLKGIITEGGKYFVVLRAQASGNTSYEIHEVLE